MQSVAVGWQVYELTHRPLDLGLVGLAQFLPGICLFLIAGHAADRFPRRRILQTCFAAFCTCSVLLLAFTLHGLSSPRTIYLVLVLNGAVRAFAMPTSQAFVPLLVPKEIFPNAVAWLFNAFQTATISGPMVGGVLYGLTGRPVVVYACAGFSYFVALLLLTQVHATQTQVRAEVRPRTEGAPGVALHGLRYIWRNKLILGAMSLDLFAVLLGGAVALLPVYAREILKIGATGLGILRSAPGVGAVITGLIVAHWPLRRWAGATMLACVFSFGLFTVAFGISHNVAISLIMLFLIGASDTISVLVRHVMIQLSTPDEMRGRVSAVNAVFIGASNEVGQFESGITAQWFGTVPAVVLGGLGTMLIVAVWTWLFPQIRKMDRLVAHQPATVSMEEPDRGAVTG